MPRPKKGCRASVTREMTLVRPAQALVTEPDLVVFEVDSDDILQGQDNLQLPNIIMEEGVAGQQSQQDFQTNQDLKVGASSSDERPKKKTKYSAVNSNWNKFNNQKLQWKNAIKQAQQNQSEVVDLVDEFEESGVVGLDEVNRRLRPHTQNIAHSPLHWELMDFAEKCAARPEEVQNIVQATDIVQQVAMSMLGQQAQAMLFGSQAVGLALPGSDLDIVILNVGICLNNPAQGFDRDEKKKVSKQLWKLFRGLKDSGVLEPEFSHTVISQAKVPIIKTMLRLANGVKLPADISIGVSNGAEAVTTVSHFVRTVPELRPLILCIKALLKEQGRNQAFTGGVSSYSVFNMVLVHLMCEGLIKGLPTTNGQTQSMAQVQDLLNAISQGLFTLSDHVNDMGELLLGFLRRYGLMMDFRRFGISIVRNRIIKKLPSWQQSDDFDVVRLAIEDHQEVGKNIGSSSYRILQVQELLKVAYETLRSEVDNLRSGIPCAQKLLSRLFHVEICLSREEWGHQARQEMESFVKKRDADDKEKEKLERKQGRKRPRND